MASDARLRESLQRAMAAIESDTESGLRDARRRGHRRLAVRGGVAFAAAAASVVIVTLAAPHIFDLTEQRPQPPSIPSPTAARSEGIVGTWRGEVTCRAFVRGFERAGIGDVAARWLVNDGLQRDPVSASGEDPCRGAEGYTRTHTFRPNGTVQTYQDQRLADDCRCYETLHGHTFFVIGKNGDRIATLRYSVEAGTLAFRAVLPNHCNNVCKGHLAWAVGNYAVTTWYRVD